MGFFLKAGSTWSLHEITTVVLDKTGTVTHGKPVLTDVITEGNIEEMAFLQLVGSAEKQSEHPLAEAIVKGIKDKGITLFYPQEFEAIPGYGIKAKVEGKNLLVGTRRLMEKYDIYVHSAKLEMETLEENGKTAMLVAVDGQYAGIVAVADTIKETSRNAINRLKQLGIEVIMITGDNKRTAQAIAEEVGIDSAIAEILPEGKAEEVKKLQNQGKKSPWSAMA